MEIEPQSFATFGELLRYLRRRARLTQRDLGIAVGYSEGHINRFEKNKHLPDPSAVAALFVPALDLVHEPSLSARLIELASASFTSTASPLELTGEPIPPAPTLEVARTHTLVLARARLAGEHRLVLCGLPGVGKTTLASALARECAPTRPVFWLTLTEGVTTSVDVLIRRLAGFLIANGRQQVKPLVATDPVTKSKLSFEQQLALLGAALAQYPVLLCFDNAELICHDEIWIQVLRHLSAAASTDLLITTRESLPLEKIAEITVDGLERDEALAFIAQSVNRALDEKLAERLVDKTGGNPMLLQLAVGQFLDARTDPETFIAHLETQPQVSNYLLETIRKELSSSAWHTLLLLAVFQQPLDLYDAHLVELAQTQGGIENVGEAIVELQRRHLIGDATSARLHPFIRDYLYLTLNTQVGLRQRLHRLAGDWLKDANMDPVAAAMHYSRARLPDQALNLIEESKEKIHAHGQGLSAVAILNEVRPQIKRLRANEKDELRRLLTLRGVFLRSTLRTREGEADLREAIGLASTPAVRATIILELALLTTRRKDYAETLRLVQTMREELKPEDVLLRARLVLLEIPAYRSLGNQEESDRKAMEVLALADQMTGLPVTITDSIRARAHYELAINASYRRDFTEMMKHGQAGLAAARAAQSIGTANLCLNLIGNLYLELGDLDTSVRYRNEAVEGLQAIGDVHSEAYIQTNLADIQHIRGEEEQALAQVERASETLHMLGDMSGWAAAEEVRTFSLIWVGRIQEARDAIERVLKEAEGLGAAPLWGYRLRKLAMLQLLQGETDAALDTLHQALALPIVPTRPMLRFELHSTLAVALMVAGDLEGAANALAEAPRFDGIARFCEHDRALIEGFVALARGECISARECANQVLTSAGQYAFYRQCAEQLLAAIEENAPVSTFPRWLWVRGG